MKMMQPVNTTATRNLQYKVEWNEPGSLVLTQNHFRIERDCFRHICQCPRTFDDFDRCHRAMAFFSCTVVDSGRVLAFKVVERITSLQFHSFVTAVEVSRRREGIARQMSAAVCSFLEEAGAKYLTKFCVPQAVALEFEDRQFVLISQEPQLGTRKRLSCRTSRRSGTRRESRYPEFNTATTILPMGERMMRSSRHTDLGMSQQ
jgi:hypothetical protein